MYTVKMAEIIICSLILQLCVCHFDLVTLSLGFDVDFEQSLIFLCKVSALEVQAHKQRSRELR